MNPYQPTPPVKITHPEWSRNAVLYQINTRQFTPEGTFRAAEAHLPRLKALGIDIVWLMPIHEIGQQNRKGTLGSPYAVRDYYSVNAEFGTLDDFRHFVEAAHALDMYVLIDWVANHTAWDNPLVTEHPEWYLRDWQGHFRPTPWWDWGDIIELDYEQESLRRYMTEAMVYWVREIGIDGYRCDVAGFVPTDFWNQVRRELDAIKPVFMLAEWESRDLHAEAFDMTYAWTWHDAVHALCMGKADVSALYVYHSWNERAYPADIMRMLFVSNHDKNAWDGTEYELFGPGVEAAVALSFVSEGMPLIYNGQEAGNARRLAFFEKDPITWQEHANADLFRRLITLKKQNSALWNAHWGARMIHVPNDQPNVFSFVRQNAQHKVFAAFNFSDHAREVRFGQALHHGAYTDFSSGQQVAFTGRETLPMQPWEYRVFTR
ncbi:MAG: alpha-amylase family glycosyl hydrolase [bacterium]|nr:alpha-amylase family glycosyl hydrolase [bacterium]